MLFLLELFLLLINFVHSVIFNTFWFLCFVVYSVSLRQQLQDVGKKLVGAQHYNKDGSVNNRQETEFFLNFLFSFYHISNMLVLNLS